jgi:PII-like signaling protein
LATTHASHSDSPGRQFRTAASTVDQSSIVAWIDALAQIERLLSAIEEMFQGRLVTTEPVAMVWHRPRTE